MQSVSVYSPNGKGATLITGYYQDETFAQLHLPRVTINGTSITKTVPGLLNLGVNVVNLGNANEIKIYKVIGYR